MKPMDRISAIQESVSVFTCGVIGVLPVAGLLHAIYAVVRGIRLRRACSEFNPVDHYRKWGVALGIFGIVFSFCVALAVGLSMASHAPPDTDNVYWID
jgi:hypothetical protein